MSSAAPGERGGGNGVGERWPLWMHVFVGGVVLGVALWLWADTFSYFFVLEDGLYLVDAQDALAPGNSFLDVRWIINRVHVRPLMILTMRAEYALFGFRPEGFHIVNVVLYACTCALMGAWLWGRHWSPAATWFAIGAFAWHPAQWPWLAIAHHGTSYFAMTGTILIVWGGQRLLEGGTARNNIMIVGGLLVGAATSEYMFSAVAAVAGVSLLRRDWRVLRVLLPLWSLVVCYVGLRVYLLLTAPTEDPTTWALYSRGALKYEHYPGKIATYAVLGLPVSNAWVLLSDHILFAKTQMYGLIAGVVSCMLFAFRWRWRAEAVHRVPVFDLVGLQALACLGILLLAPWIHFGRALHPAFGITLALCWILRPLLRRPLGLFVCVVLLAGNSVLGVQALRAGRFSTLPVKQLQAQNAKHIATYQNTIARYPALDAVYVHGIPEFPDFRRSLLQAAAPSRLRWLSDPAASEGFRNAIVFAMIGPREFGAVGVVHTREELSDLLARLPQGYSGSW